MEGSGVPTAFGVWVGIFKRMPPFALPVELLSLSGFVIPERLPFLTLMN